MVACAAVALAVCVPAGAAASSSGEITRALVSPDWTTASIAGKAVRSNGCLVAPEQPPSKGSEKEKPEPPPPPESPPGVCGWIPFATVGPGSSQADCSGRGWESLGEGVQLAWVGPELQEPGSATFDLTSVSAQNGAAAPLLCLSAVETDYESKMCIPEIDCSGYRYVHRTYQLDSALLEVVTAMASEQSQLSTAPGLGPCKKPRQRQKRSQKLAGLALGPSVRVKGQPKRVRRCKTG